MKLIFIRNTLTIVMAFVILALGVYFSYKYFLGPGSRGIKIDNTAIIIEEVKKISQMFTASYYDEMAIDTFKYQEKDLISRAWTGLVAPRPGFRKSDTDIGLRRVELVVVARGTIMAGYDLSEIQLEDMIIEGKTVTLVLPPPQILEVIINPSDFEIFFEEGRWELHDVLEVQTKAAFTMQQRAIERGIFEASQINATRILQNYFLSLGFSHVIIKTAPEGASEPLRVYPSLE
jgi:hypothetical protein